jgi:predicted enzyme related to lactoylglutathione lyase
MTSRIRHITVDSADPWAQAGFWSQVVGYPVADGDEPGDDEVLIVAPDDAGPGMLFIAVPEGKSGKNRLHVDVQPGDRTRDEEVDRLLGLGATLVADHRRPDGTGWAVLGDPEGNEFCVERSAGERPTG